MPLYLMHGTADRILEPAPAASTIKALTPTLTGAAVTTDGADAITGPMWSS